MLLLLWLINRLMETNIDKQFLIKEGFGFLRNHLFDGRLDTIPYSWLNKFCAWRKITLPFHLFQVLLHLWFMLRIRDFIYIIAQHVAELWFIHSFGECFEFSFVHIHFLAFHQWILDVFFIIFLFSLLFFECKFGFYFHSTSALRRIRVK